MMRDKKFYLCKNKTTKTWYVYIYDYTDDGKRYKERSFSTRQTVKSAARDKLNKYIISLQNQEKEQMLKRNITLSEFYKEIKQHLVSNLSRSTVNIYNLAVRKFLELISDKQLRLIMSSDIENFKELRLNQGVSKYMVNKEYSCMKALFNNAIRMNFLNTNPCRFVKKYTITEKKILAFNDAEIKLLLSNIKNDTLHNIVEFGLLSGLRLKEILNMQIKDIDFVNGVINVVNKENFTTKNRRNKICILSSKLRCLINKILNINDIENISSIPELSPDRYLFHPENRNSPFHTSYISHLFKMELRKHNSISENMHFHCLRHTYISRLINKGVPINFVQMLVSHANISTTMNYIHLNKQELIRYAEF